MEKVMAEERKKELVERAALDFTKLHPDNKMFILGYMLGIQQERQSKEPQTA